MALPVIDFPHNTSWSIEYMRVSFTSKMARRDFLSNLSDCAEVVISTILSTIDKARMPDG